MKFILAGNLFCVCCRTGTWVSEAMLVSVFMLCLLVVCVCVSACTCTYLCVHVCMMKYICMSVCVISVPAP